MASAPIFAKPLKHSATPSHDLDPTYGVSAKAKAALGLLRNLLADLAHSIEAS